MDSSIQVVPSPLERVIQRLRGRHFRGRGRLLLALSPSGGERLIALPGGARLRCDLADPLQRLMYVDILHHDWLPVLPLLLGPGSTFVDVGANVGYFAVLAASLVGERGRVVAVEPVPRTRERLLANLALNAAERVLVEPRALAAAAGSLTLHVPPRDLNRDYLASRVAVSGNEPIAVPCVALDAAVEDWGIGRIDLMKLDVEGAEPLVVDGGERTLASGRVRALVVEFSGAHLRDGGTTCDAFAARIERLGFLPARFARGRRLAAARRIPMDEARDHNRLFVHASAAAEVAAFSRARAAARAPRRWFASARR